MFAIYLAFLKQPKIKKTTMINLIVAVITSPQIALQNSNKNAQEKSENCLDKSGKVKKKSKQITKQQNAIS